MKKLIVTLLCGVLLCAMLLPAAFAASESIEMELNGKQLTLLFDPSEQFSNIVDGNVQASFYTYLDGSDDLYELYLVFPQDVQSGATIDPQYAQKNAPDASVGMCITLNSQTNFYFAGQTDNTDYTIAFESVEETGSGRMYSGTLSATMIGVSEDFETEVAPISIKNARFSFTMPTGNVIQPGNTPDDSTPPATDHPEDDGYNPFANPTPSPTKELVPV